MIYPHTYTIGVTCVSREGLPSHLVYMWGEFGIINLWIFLMIKSS